MLKKILKEINILSVFKGIGIGVLVVAIILLLILAITPKDSIFTSYALLFFYLLVIVTYFGYKIAGSIFAKR